MLDIDLRKIKPYPTRWWGTDYICRPQFVHTALGDGNQLIGIEPLNTRPHYYLIRVDSSWHLQSCRICRDRDCPDELTEHLDEIYDAIVEEYMAVETVRECNEDFPEEEPDSEEWPVFSSDSGVSWFRLRDDYRKIKGERHYLLYNMHGKQEIVFAKRKKQAKRKLARTWGGYNVQV